MISALVSTYEGGMQPLGIATAAAHLLDSRIEILAFDASLEGVDAVMLSGARLVAFSVPLFDAMAPAVKLATELRNLGWDRTIVFYGAYATLQHQLLLGKYADGVILGDWEHAIVEIARRCEAGFYDARRFDRRRPPIVVLSTRSSGGAMRAIASGSISSARRYRRCPIAAPLITRRPSSPSRRAAASP